MFSQVEGNKEGSVTSLGMSTVRPPSLCRSTVGLHLATPFEVHNDHIAYFGELCAEVTYATLIVTRAQFVALSSVAT